VDQGLTDAAVYVHGGHCVCIHQVAALLRHGCHREDLIALRSTVIQSSFSSRESTAQIQSRFDVRSLIAFCTTIHSEPKRTNQHNYTSQPVEHGSLFQTSNPLYLNRQIIFVVHKLLRNFHKITIRRFTSTEMHPHQACIYHGDLTPWEVPDPQSPIQSMKQLVRGWLYCWMHSTI